ncbi:MAG: hypothetical protein UF379_01315 [Oscillospiraceae bacterium]|nr:hypothetical protein [Oscillospiraceae bacterium]
MKKRVLSLLLAVVMVWSLLPTAVLAAGGELAGDGRADSPYQIAGAADLMAFAEMVNGGKSGICAELTANIDLTGEDWVPIGVKGASYSGTFDGKYFTVTLDITADGSYEYEYIGLFGYLENAAIRNLKTDGSIRVTADCQSYPVVGGIAACVGSYSGFTNCKNAIAITVDEGTVLNGNGVGGIVGMMYADATFEQCTNWGDISIGSNAYSMGVGGIAGYSDAVIQISYCYNYADIEYYDDVMGGLIGSCNDITAVGCYSAASAEPHNAPRGLEGKTLSGNDYGDLFGGTSSYTLERMLIYCDQFGAYNNISDDDFDETQISKSNYMSPQKMVEYLNGDDGAIYTADSDIAGGWPVLAWELKTPTVVTNPEEAAYAKAENDFKAAKTAALDKLKNDFNTYDKSQYSDTGWTSLNSIYNKAKAALNGASLTPYGKLEDKSVDAITAYAQAEIDKLMPIAQTALAEMKAVPTKAQETQFVKEKENAIRDLEDAYTNELKKLNDLRGEAAAVWHGINGDVLTQLAEKSAALDDALSDGTAKLDACTNTVALDATLRSSKAALSAVLQGFTVSVDSGVRDKWDGSSKTQPSGSGTAASPYKIGTAAQLAWFANAVNNGSRSACAVLTADIDLNGQEWTPIANSGVNNGYTGTFDGQGHVIHGICVTTGVSSRPQGLFGIIARTGTVRNVKAAGRVLVRQSSGAGLIAGENNGVLYNCEASAFLKNSYNAGSTGSSVGNIGGIAGHMAAGYIENCRAYGLFLANPESYDEGNLVNSSMLCQIGGIVGGMGASQEKDGCLVRYCENHLQIDCYTFTYGNSSPCGYAIGGIVGGSGIGKVRECVNRAAVTGGYDVGGIVGSATPGEGASFSAAYVENRGTVRSGSSTAGGRGAGGILGKAGSEKTTGGSSQYVGDVSLTHAYNSGAVSAAASGTTNGIAGGIIGVWLSGTVTHARSSSDTSLWGIANMATTGSSDTAKVASYGSPVRADGGTAQKLSATQALLGKLIRFDAKRDGSYAVYGDQSAAYNAVIMDYVRRIEEAADSAVGALLTEADAALSAVPTQLQADKAALLADMRAYAAANIYDTDEQSAMDALLETAAQAIDSAATVAAVAKLRQVYMGTENIDGELAGIKTYPAKAADELYNKYIFDRSYAPEDMAKALRAYEGWKLKLFSAPDLDGVEAVYADARKAMDALTRDFTTGDTAPDMDTAASAARALARQEVLDSLAMLEQGYIDALTAIAGDMDALSYAWKARLTAVLDSGKAALHAAATPALEDIDDYGVLEDKLATGKQALSDIFADVSARLTALAASAANESAWNGTTVEPGKDASGVYQIGTAEELAWLAAEINNSSNNSQSYSAVLTADIDLGYRPWTPIGCYVDWQNNHPYRGVFDGQGHTVSGLYVTALSNGYAGLFGYTSGSTTIKNLTVEGEIRLEDVSTTAKHIGGIVGEANAKLERCVSRVRISAAGFGTRDTCAVGGIAGKLSGAMTDCRFEGSIDITCKRGGAYISGGVGGLAGNAAGGALTRCVNTGAVTVDKGTGVGGIAGITSREVTFTQCANTGHISNDTAAVLSSGEKPKGGTGGILGVGKSGNVSISLCYNTGTVSGTTIVGGILGGEAGDYGTSISNGNPSLTVENCYNAGLLDVGSRTNRIGSLVGFPIAGQYRDGLYVLGSSSRQAKGWFSSQGECITVLDTLTAAAINRTSDMVDSIAQLNSGCPLFMWQLEETASRSAVIAYLRSYYTDNVRTAATPAQRDALETQLTETEAVINAPSSKAPAIVEAYETMLSAMNADTLVQAAKDETKAELNRLKEDSAKTYPAIKDKLKALLDDRLAALDKCKTGAEVQSCVDAFAAGVVDLLIDDAAGARLKELETKLKTIESAYNALDKTRQSLVTKYGKLAGMQQLYKQYTENLEALKKWYDEDCKRYDYIKKTVEKLYNGAVTQLGECTDKAAMDAVMNGYVVDIAEALTGDIAYKPGKTPASALKNLETRIKNARTAYNSLTAEQKQLFDKDLLASLQGAESLLSAYNSGISSLSSRLQQDKKAYPDLSDKLERLASRARNAMDSSVDTSGILSALDRYAASVVDALIDDIGYVPDVMSESDAAVLRGKISRAQSAYNALTAAQKKLVKGVTALETAAARMAAYEENYKAAQRVVELIKAIGTVTKDSYDAIKRATDAYNALTPVQKALVPQWAIDLLEEATAKYKELTAADDTASAEQPAELPLDDLRTEEAAKPDRPFDWTIVWMGAGILAALGIIVLLWKWFSATKQARRRNDE